MLLHETIVEALHQSRPVHLVDCQHKVEEMT